MTPPAWNMALIGGASLACSSSTEEASSHTLLTSQRTAVMGVDILAKQRDRLFEEAWRLSSTTRVPGHVTATQVPRRSPMSPKPPVTITVLCMFASTADSVGGRFTHFLSCGTNHRPPEVRLPKLSVPGSASLVLSTELSKP